ncbi:DNA-binding HxlR family transcriptional regulator [Amycolatopsis endophytica]|uniref:DNA-binding HxlR family transcriptional regulator n=1 Tax=Amycolatopsis endophytica TaxID=860233 RepID=A0A853B6L0_9PSEU|nr:helix-turn-helix domain-containing protein [Amycolatopsis endophytica]NYI90371.1 DNA-binding HxlR family transcriptional regulator [Amycolatopsis endophytica]
MSVRRTRYHCPVELAVDVIGGKWAVVILAHLKESEHRYGELRRRLPGISEKMLTTRLRELEAAGLVERIAAEGKVPAVTYRLAPEGRELAPALQILYDWGERRAKREGVPIEPV